MPDVRPDVLMILESLERSHGRAQYELRLDPLEELVCCILSQHSTDVVSFPTFHRLRSMVPTWPDLAGLHQEELADLIRPAGLANQKAKSILGCLKAIDAHLGDYSLDALENWPTERGREFLRSLPGVGPKTAAIVLCFALGRDVVPVDTHVFRVAKRIGWLAPGVTEAKAHDLFDAIAPPGMAYRLHVALIAHGRQVCRSRKPQCETCSIASDCDWNRSQQQ